MNATLGEDTPPKSTDLEGWRQAIAEHRLATYRLEVLVAALQDLGPNTDTRVRNALAKHLSDSMMHLLRKHVGFNKQNQGEDIIYRIHADMFEAILDPISADGKALRLAFAPRVLFRVKDAIAAENRHGQIPTEGKIKVSRKGQKATEDKFTEIIQTTAPAEPPEPANDSNLSDGEEAGAVIANRDLSLLDGVRDLDEQIYVDRLLERVTDDRKRLAFYLHMDQVPCKSKSFGSIAKAIGKSSKTAENWIAEVQELLKSDKEVQELRGSRTGDKK